jgi:hypothetical protein
MFGFSDWQFAGKELEDTDGPVDIGFSVSGGLQSGTWSVIEALFDTYANLMIVVKGGEGNNTQPEYVGYLFTSAKSGDYSTPFFNATGGGAGNPKNISHMTAYVQGTCTPTPENGFCGSDTTPVPVPAGLPLMLTAMGVGAFMRSRSRKSA